MNMRPKTCKPSHEAHQTSSFETYLPNLTSCSNSRRRRTTDFIFKDTPRNTYAAKTMRYLVRSPTNKFIENISLQSDGLQKFQPTLHHRFGSSRDGIFHHLFGSSLIATSAPHPLETVRVPIGPLNPLIKHSPKGASCNHTSQVPGRGASHEH